MFVSKISREEIAKLDIVQFSGRIHLIDSLKKFDAAYPLISEQSVLGFDTETRPSFRKGKIYSMSLIQLSSSNDVWLIRINMIGLPGRLNALLENKQVIKIGAGLNDDFHRIRDVGKINPGGFIDLQKYVEEFNIESKSVKKLTAIILGFRISKSQQLSNWNAEILTEAQQRYAATDAWVCYEMYRALLHYKSELNG